MLCDVVQEDGRVPLTFATPPLAIQLMRSRGGSVWVAPPSGEMACCQCLWMGDISLKKGDLDERVANLNNWRWSTLYRTAPHAQVSKYEQSDKRYNWRRSGRHFEVVTSKWFQSSSMLSSVIEIRRELICVWSERLLVSVRESCV